MNFEQARAEYDRLRQSYENRTMTPEEYTRGVQALQVRDASGGYWAIDGSTGDWLRYDGSAWVPSQPPVSQSYTPPPQGGYGPGDATQIAGPSYGQPPQGGYAAPAPGYAARPQAAPDSSTPQPEASAPPRSRNKALIAGCLATAAVFLLFCVGLGAFAFVNGVFDRSTGITEAATASSINSRNEPEREVSEFNPNSPVFITYTAKNVKQGQKVSIRLFRDGTPQTLLGGETTFSEDRRTVNGHFRYTPSQRGDYRAELYLDNESAPSETVNFTVR